MTNFHNVPSSPTGAFLLTGHLPANNESARAATRDCYDALPVDSDRPAWAAALVDFIGATNDAERDRARAALVAMRAAIDAAAP